MNKPAPNEKLRTVLGSLQTRFDLILGKIQKAETEGRISHEKANELRGMLK